MYEIFHPKFSTFYFLLNVTYNSIEMTNVYLLQCRLLAGKVLSADWIMRNLVMIDRVHSRAIGLQFVSVDKFSLALGNLFQLEKRELFRDHCKYFTRFYRSKNLSLQDARFYFCCKRWKIWFYVDSSCEDELLLDIINIKRYLIFFT